MLSIKNPAMTHVLISPTKDALANAIQASAFAYVGNSARCETSEYVEGDGFVRWHTPLAGMPHNGIAFSRPASEADNALVAETIEYFKSRGIRRFITWLGTDAEPSTWDIILKQNGFTHYSGEPGMAIHLNTLSDDPLFLPDHLSIEVIKDQQGVVDFVHALTTGLGIPDTTPAFLSWVTGFHTGGSARMYLARRNGKPIATTMLLAAAGVVGIYLVSTVPEERKQGIGTSLTRAALEEGRKSGYQVAVLQASKMGFPVYQHLGFEQICTMQYYAWLNPA
jgi:GNAT superfamily N-acetyltransferase